MGRARRKGEDGSGELIIHVNQNIDELKKNIDIRDGLYETVFNKFCNIWQIFLMIMPIVILIVKNNLLKFIWKKIKSIRKKKEIKEESQNID